MTVTVHTTAYGAAALHVLRTVIGRAKRNDPMAPVTVIAPNNVGAIVARRHLAAGTPEHRGIAGIEVITLARLAERMTTSVVAPRRPMSRAVLAAAWRQALTDHPGRFADIAEHPATIRALVAAHVELRDLSEPALAAVADSAEIAAELVAAHRAVARRLAVDWYDDTDILHAAADVPARTALGPPVLYLPQRLTQAQARFVRSLADGADLTVVAGLTGARRADEAVHRTLALLGTQAGIRPAIATASHVINASDADDEVRYVIRDLVDTLATTPAHRVALLYSAASPYARLTHEQLAAAGITVNGPGSRATDERAVTRALLELIALARHDVPRAELFRALAQAPTKDFSGRRIPISRWERISRTAGVVSGEDWTTRLAAYIDDQRARAGQHRASEDPQQWQIDKYDAAVETATALQDYTRHLRTELHRAAALTTWAELAAWTRNLFLTLIVAGEDLQSLPAPEQYAVVPIMSLLQTLQNLDSIESSASLTSLLDILDAELAAALPRVGRFGDGVFVAPLSEAIGLDVDVLYVVGLSEDLYPGRLHADALLPERTRDASLGELPSYRDRLHGQFRHLLAALTAADRVVVSFPRGDLRRASRRLPSRWLLPSLRELGHDKELAATEWEFGAYGAALSTAGSFAGELLVSERLSTEQEWRTRQAACAGDLDDEVVRAAVDMIRARGATAFTRFDGNLTGVDGLPDYATGDRLISPTALESFAQCPHAFFVKRLLKVDPLDQPEDIIQISPMDIGNLVHESLDALVTACGDDLPGYGEPWTAAQRHMLRDIATERAADFQRRGLTGHPRLWNPERARIVADMDRLLDADDDWRARIGAKVLASEMPFGLRGAAAVEVSIPGGRILMRGSADKVDVDAAGKIYVADLKTGSRRKYKSITQGDPLGGGSTLQLPIYAYAARARYGEDRTPVHASYWFVRREPGRIGIDLTAEVEENYADTLAVLVQSVARGLFPLRAPENPDFAWVQCDYCNPDGIGHADNRHRWERKRHDKELRDLVALIEPAAVQ